MRVLRRNISVRLNQTIRSWHLAVRVLDREAEMQKVAAALAARHIQRIISGHLKAAFESWSAAVRDRHLAATRLGRLVLRCTFSRLNSALRFWVSATQKVHASFRGISIMRRVHSRMISAQLDIAFGNWLSATRNQRVKEAISLRRQNMDLIATDRTARTLRRKHCGAA